jgi:hypothetical protein
MVLIVQALVEVVRFACNPVAVNVVVITVPTFAAVGDDVATTAEKLGATISCVAVEVAALLTFPETSVAVEDAVIVPSDNAPGLAVVPSNVIEYVVPPPVSCSVVEVLFVPSVKVTVTKAFDSAVPTTIIAVFSARLILLSVAIEPIVGAEGADTSFVADPGVAALTFPAASVAVEDAVIVPSRRPVAFNVIV